MNTCIPFIKALTKNTLLLMAVIYSTHGQLYSQVDCNLATLACNDLVYVALDEDCEVVISPDMILEAPEYDESVYTVTIMHGNVVLPTNTVTAEHIGLPLQVSIAIEQCGISCWGNMTVEDKLPPVITNCVDATIKCFDSSEVGSPLVPTPVATDACDGVITMTHVDEAQNFMCDGDYGKIITRTWQAVDSHGNTASCVQTIRIERASLADANKPDDYDGLPGNKPMFLCTSQFKKLPNGAPHPDVTGRPISQACNTINQYFSDVEFEICGASKKYVRNWIVIDWCEGMEESYNQIIKIADNQKPVCLDNPNIVLETTTDPEKCTADYVVPAPKVSDCSNWTYTVQKIVTGSPYPTSEGVVKSGNTYTIKDLPVGTSRIQYTITDDCGNESKCYRDIKVEDTQIPTAICLAYTVVTINETGMAEVFASSFDDESHDNCAIDTILVKRLRDNCSNSANLQFRDRVSFCCNDITGTYQQVVLRVIDIYGNYNDCMANVSVEDKFPPQITCPEKNVYVDCGDDTSPSNTGMATATDNCSVSVSHKDINYINDCGIGYIRREWTATDVSGRKTKCTQFIYIEKKTPFTTNSIGWPADREVSGCMSSDLSPKTLNSEVTLSNTECTNLGISHHDQIFTNIDGYCFKIIRTWKVINWCAGEDAPPFVHEQTIAVRNTEGPKFTSGCEPFTIDAPEGTCEAQVSFEATATDDCTPTADIVWKYKVDLHKNGVIDISGKGNSYAGTLPTGEHTIEWEITDDCGNYNACKKNIYIKDTKAPTPVCLGTVIWVLNDEGKTEIWASDFDKQSYDACGDTKLRFAFDEKGQHTALSFDCSDIPNGISMDIPLRMYVIDSHDNYDYCEIILRLQDSQETNACPDNNSGRPVVSGRLLDSELKGLPNMEIKLSSTAENSISEMSTDNGDYTAQVDYYEKYSVHAQKKDEAKNGVNTRDLIAIQRHMLGIEKIDNPYKLIAADVDNSKSISPRDLLDIRKVILGLESNFKGGTSWKFIDASTTFNNIQRPFDYQMYVSLDKIYTDINDINLIGIKLGDVNNTAARGLRQEGNIESRSSTVLYIDTDSYEAGAKLMIPVYAKDIHHLMGIQMGLHVSKELSIHAIKPGHLSIDNSNFVVDNNRIAISWNKATSLEVDTDEALFYIEATALSSGNTHNSIRLDDTQLSSEVYIDEAVTESITLAVRQGSAAQTSVSALFQNAPNPCTTETLVSFNLEKDENIEMQVFDVQGAFKMVKNLKGRQGHNTYKLDLEDMDAGIYYYSIKGKAFTHTKRMIVVK